MLKESGADIYFRERTGTTNRVIGEFLGGLTCSAVAKIYRKITQDMRGDKKLRRVILQLEKNPDTFKTPFFPLTFIQAKYL